MLTKPPIGGMEKKSVRFALLDISIFETILPGATTKLRDVNMVSVYQIVFHLDHTVPR